MFFRFIAGIVIGSIVLCLRSVSAETPLVVINELMWMGSSISSADEWIELRNMTAAPIDIGGWSITKKSSGAEAPMLTIPSDTTIAPHGYFIISNYTVGSSSILTVAPDLVTSDVALANTSLQIKLYDATYTLIDTADDGVGMPLAGKYTSADLVYSSMERNSEPGDGTLPVSWHTASTPIAVNTTEFGSPDTDNSNAAPIAIAGDDLIGEVGTEVLFDGSESYDPDGGSLTFKWSFGDGTTAASATPSHRYDAPGTFDVVLTVTDGVHSATDMVQVVIKAAITTSASNTNAAIPTNTSVQQNRSCQGLRIVRVVPNPAGTDTTESVSLNNPTIRPIDPSGCSLIAGAGRTILTDLSVIDAGGTRILTYQDTRLRLPNSGATVELHDVDDRVLDAVTYPVAKDDQAWIRTTTGWAWETTTESSDPPTQTNNQNTTSGSKKKSPPPVTNLSTLSELAERASGDRVTFRGTISSPLDLVGSGILTLADQSAAIMVSVGAGAPSLAVGDVLRATGTVRIRDGIRRIAIDEDSIIRDGHELLTPATIECDAIGLDDTNRLVTVEGVIVAVSGNRFDVDDGRDILTVNLKTASGIVRPRMATGDRASVIGILNVTTAGAKLLPRTNDDVRVSRMSPESIVPESLPATTKVGQLWYWGAAALGGLMIGLKPMITQFRARLASRRAE